MPFAISQLGEELIANNTSQFRGSYGRNVVHRIPRVEHPVLDYIRGERSVSTGRRLDTSLSLKKRSRRFRANPWVGGINPKSLISEHALPNFYFNRAFVGEWDTKNKRRSISQVVEVSWAIVNATSGKVAHYLTSNPIAIRCRKPPCALAWITSCVSKINDQTWMIAQWLNDKEYPVGFFIVQIHHDTIEDLSLRDFNTLPDALTRMAVNTTHCDRVHYGVSVRWGVGMTHREDTVYIWGECPGGGLILAKTPACGFPLTLGCSVRLMTSSGWSRPSLGVNEPHVIIKSDLAFELVKYGSPVLVGREWYAPVAGKRGMVLVIQLYSSKNILGPFRKVAQGSSKVPPDSTPSPPDVFVEASDCNMLVISYSLHGRLPYLDKGMGELHVPHFAEADVKTGSINIRDLDFKP